jgi:hypothetical protein
MAGATQRRLATPAFSRRRRIACRDDRRDLKRENPMLQTLTAIAALAALLAINITPAHAVLSGNGGGANGLELNGGGSNGGGANGTGENGISEASSTLSIQSFELPPQKR